MFCALFIQYIVTYLYKFKGGGDEYEEIDSIDFNKRSNVDSMLEYALKRGRNNEYFFHKFQYLE